VLLDGSYFSVQRVVNNGPVTKTIGEVVLWLAKHSKLGVTEINVRDLDFANETGV
jgi:hypothetical protein